MSPTVDGATPHDVPGHTTGPAPVAQWVGLLFAPAVFFVHLQVGYLLVLWACGRPGGALWVHVAGALSVVLSAVGLFAAWITWQRAGAEKPGDAGGDIPRTRLLGATGLGTSAALVMLLIWQWIAVFITPMCQ